jgi:2-oxoisovalerate dehydrogenase E1 component beta subunit
MSQGKVRSMNMVQALNSAMDIMLERDSTVVVFGEDVGYFGGVFRVTEGLQKKYGAHRVIDSPIAEGGIVGSAIGMGANGLRPVAEIQFADYIYPAFDQITGQLARIRYRSASEYSAPITIRTPCGGGIRGGQTHSQSPEALFAHISGIKVVMPSNPYDAKGLLIAAIEDDDPVIFFEPKRIYNGPFDGDPNKPAVGWDKHEQGKVPEGYYSLPIGKAAVVRPGSEITIVTYGTMVHVCLAAANELNLDAEVIDIRSMVPLDLPTITASVSKTGRCLIAHEATRFGGFGGELSASIQEECFWDLEAPIVRVAGWDTPYPLAFEWEYFPGKLRVKMALQKLMQAA